MLTKIAHPLKEGKPLISSVRLEISPGHDLIHVWNRGGKSGILTVNKGEGYAICELLLPEGTWED